MAGPVKRVRSLPLRPQPQQAMSLLELMIAIGIVLLLAAISLSVYSRIARIKDQTVCNSNLRQIGVAVINYANDHQGVLPGPVTATQRASYTSHQVKTAPISLVHYLAPYLDLAPPASKQVAAIFQCPAQAKLRPGEDDAVFYLHRQTVFQDGTAQRPFGYQAGGATSSPPLRLGNIVHPAQTVAIFDTSGPAPVLEVHFQSRNVLFIDGHTEQLDSTRLIFDASSVIIR